MKTQIRTVFFATCMAALVPIGAAGAQQKECSVARPANAQGHWSWRLIDGRKCWYVGNTMIPKSLLRWPAEASAQTKGDATPVSAAMEKRRDLIDAQARLLDDDDSFESRWRARAISE